MAVKQDAVKNAHMVSKGYIRAWADKRNVVDVLDLQDGRGYPASYLSATVVSYAYDPNVLTHNLERYYSLIEDAGTPALVKMREGEPLTTAEARAVIAFLDMHLDRGRYADRTQVRAPAVVLRADGRIEQTELALGDALLLSTISFPLSPTQLLVIGEDLPDDGPHNRLLAENSKRWIVGARGSLNFIKAAVVAAKRSQK
jgi:hypothetical protein